MNDLIQTSEFDPIIKYIVECRHDLNSHWFKFELPVDFVIDIDKVKQYFEDDAALSMSQNNYVKVFYGTIKDYQLGEYLRLRMQNSFTFHFIDDGSNNIDAYIKSKSNGTNDTKSITQ